MTTEKRDRYSALVVISAFIAFVLIAWITADRPPEKSLEYPTSENNKNGQQSYIQQPETVGIRPWWQDSYAQWLMALTSLAAGGISYWAVILVNATLAENKRATRAAEEAVAEARRASDAQLRPYIVYDTVKINNLQSADGSIKILELDISFRNCGMSPGILTAASSAKYAPDGSGTWPSSGGSWRPVRMVIGPNQTEKIRFEGMQTHGDGTFSWFTIGILIWYENLAGTKFEDHVWLTYDGTGLRQDHHTSSNYELYRRSED